MENQIDIYSIIARAALNNMLGKSFKGYRDIYEAFGYKKELNYEDYATQYSRHDIAKAIIKRPAQDTWAGDLHVSEPGTEEDTPLEKGFDILEKKIKLKTKFARLDRLSALGQYGILLLGLSDCKKREDFANPVKSTNLDLNYIKPLGQGSCEVSTYENNTSNERYGLPKTYSLTLKNSTRPLLVHHSRVIHVAWDLMENENEGTPVMEAVFNRLQDLEKLVGGSAEMFWRGARPGYQGIVDPDFSLGEDTRKAIKENIDEYEGGLRRFFIQQGIELKDLAPQVEDPTNHVKVQVQMISAVTGIPQRILLGSERGELASGQDADAWKTLISNRRTEQVEPTIVRPFVDRMIEYGVLPKPKTGQYTVQWSDLFAPSEKERAETGKTRAIALSEYSKTPLAAEVMPPSLFAQFFLGFSKEQIQLVEQMKKNSREDEEFLIKKLEQQQIALNKKE